MKVKQLKQNLKQNAMNQSKMRINLATMSRVMLDETPALEQLIQHFSWAFPLLLTVVF